MSTVRKKTIKTSEPLLKNETPIKESTEIIETLNNNTEKNEIIESKFNTVIEAKLDELSEKIEIAERVDELHERIDNLSSIVDAKATTSKGFFGKFLQTLFHSGSGNSSMRLIFFVWAIGTWILWAGMSLFKNELQPISPELAAILGALGLAKAGQKFGELHNRF